VKKTPIQQLHEILDDLEEGVDGHGGTYVNAADWRRLNVVAADIEAEFGTKINVESQKAFDLCADLLERTLGYHTSHPKEIL
jgi:hypothetical protein